MKALCCCITDRNKFLLLVGVIVLMFCVEMWQEYSSFTRDDANPNSISTNTGSGVHGTVRRQHMFNHERARSGINYPICGKLDELEQDLQKEEGNRPSAEKKYEEMLRAGLMNCGHIRVGLGIFVRRFVI
jgi:hypothetical protein